MPSKYVARFKPRTTSDPIRKQQSMTASHKGCELCAIGHTGPHNPKMHNRDVGPEKFGRYRKGLKPLQPARISGATSGGRFLINVLNSLRRMAGGGN